MEEFLHYVVKITGLIDDFAAANEHHYIKHAQGVGLSHEIYIRARDHHIV